jgi:hypothetical protein
MKGRLKILLSILLSAVVVFHLAGLDDAAAQAVEILTKEEGAMANAPSDPIDVGNALDVGPTINIIKPEQNVPLRSPIPIIVRFVPNGKDVDLSALKVEVMKFVTIDITERVLPYASREGIHVENAFLPSGDHVLRLTIGDVNGGISQKLIQIKIL